MDSHLWFDQSSPTQNPSKRKTRANLSYKIIHKEEGISRVTNLTFNLNWFSEIWGVLEPNFRIRAWLSPSKPPKAWIFLLTSPANRSPHRQPTLAWPGRRPAWLCAAPARLRAAPSRLCAAVLWWRAAAPPALASAGVVREREREIWVKEKGFVWILGLDFGRVLSFFYREERNFSSQILT